MHMIAGALGEPALDHGRRVRARVVEHQMHVERRRDGGINRIEEVPELHAPMPLVQFAHHRAALHVQRGEEIARPVPDIVMTVAFDLARAHRPDGRRPFRRLNLGLLVDAEHERAVGRLV